MSELIRSFTFGRNALKRTSAASADSAIRCIELAEDGVDLAVLKRTDNGAYNVITDAISFLSIIVRSGNGSEITEVGQTYSNLYQHDKDDAWRWLITRALWLYVVPNGTKAAVNAAAASLGAAFGFFRLILGVVSKLAAFSDDERFLYYDELLSILKSDDSWFLDADHFVERVIQARGGGGVLSPSQRGLLGDLEVEHGIPRDNFNGVLNKAFQQTGLFDYAVTGGRVVGISIAPWIDEILLRRIAFVESHPVLWDGTDWQQFVRLRTDDLPQQLSQAPVIDQPEALPAALAPDVEGINDEQAVAVDAYPIDGVLIRTETRTVHDVVRRMTAGTYIMDPDFQRDFVWNEDQQSKLIESALMRIPLPVFYLAEREDGKIVVVDGLQRLTTFRRFLKDEFALRKLAYASHLNGRKFSDLQPKLQNRIEDTNLVLYLIDQKVPETAKLDIFDRVNSGVALTRQQMRNCIYLGPGTRWLKSASRTESFRAATGGSLNSLTMRDRECINRFCGFYLLGVDSYRGDMDAFLAETLRVMNGYEASTLQGLFTTFERSMRNNLRLFGKYAFRKHSSASDRRNVINIALFDVYSVLMADFAVDSLLRRAGKVHAAFYRLMENSEFEDAISFSTNSTRQVQTRFRLARKSVEEAMTDVDNTESQIV